MEDFKEYKEVIKDTLDEILEACPAMSEKFYLGGTTPVSVLYLKHAISLDLDIHTQGALEPTTQEAKDLKAHFGRRLEWFEADPEFGIFRGTIKTGHSEKGKPIFVEIDVFSNFEDVEKDHIEKTSFSRMPTLTLKGYLATKLGCLEERHEAKDLYHLYCLARKPGWKEKVEAGLKSVDPLELKLNQANFLKEWPEIKKSVRRTGGMTPLDENDLLGWVKSLGAPKRKIRPCGEQTPGLP